ncbi:MAG: lipopolysaccharide heptosyltransferase II [Planctomycetota bacterium]
MPRIALDSRDFQPRAILCRAPNPLGDAVMAEPALRAIARRFPDAAIDLQIHQPSAPLAQGWNFLRDILPLKIRKAFVGIADRYAAAGDLRRRCYDLCVLFPNSLDSAILPFMAGIPRIAGYARHGRSALLSDRIPFHRDRRAEHMVEYYWRIAELLGCGPLPVSALIDAEPERTAAILGASDLTAPHLTVTAEMRERARAILAARLPAPNASFLAVAPGAAYGPAKQWPTERFTEFCRGAVARFGQPVVLLGTRSEVPLCDAICAAAGILPHPVLNLAGATDLATMLGVLAAASGFVGNDSGAAHLAAALGLPGVAIFGSTSDRHSGQVGPFMRIRHLHLSCSPCFKRVCPLGHLNCLKQIEPASVLDLLAAVIERRRSVGPVASVDSPAP